MILTITEPTGQTTTEEIDDNDALTCFAAYDDWQWIEHDSIIRHDAPYWYGDVIEKL